MAGDDEAGSGATTTAETDRPRSEHAATPDAPPSEREGSEEVPAGGDVDPPVAAVAGRSDHGTGDEAEDDATGATNASDTRSDPGGEVEAGPGLDVDAAEARLEEVKEQIEEGRRALTDIARETDPQPEGPPVARGEGAANAPPG